MSTTIDQLELEVKANANSAVSGLDALATSLGRLKTATARGGAKLEPLAKQLTILNSALKSINTEDVNKLTNLTNTMQSLSSVGKINLSTTAKQITSVGTAVRGLDGADFSKVNTLVNSLAPLSTVGKSNLNSFIYQLSRLPATAQALNSVNLEGFGSQINGLVSSLAPLSSMGKNNLTSFITQLKKLPEAVQSLKSVDIGKLASDVQRLANAFRPLGDEMQKVSMGFSAMPSRLQRLIRETEKLSTANNKATNSYVGLIAKMGIALGTVSRLARGMAGMVYQGMQWDGIAERFTSTFGDSAKEAYDWVQKLQDKMSINPQQFMQYSSVYNSMLQGYGVNQADASKMATGYTELAYDIWARYEDVYRTFDDAATAVRATISGEVESIRRAGFTIVDSQLAITAANHGIAYSTQTASEEMKSYLRYLTLVDQAHANSTVGAYAKEMDTLAGMIRTLRQQVATLAQAWGQLLIPALMEIVPWLQAIISLATDAAVALAALFGIELTPIGFGGGGGATRGLERSVNESAAIADNIGAVTNESAAIAENIGGMINESSSIADNIGGAVKGTDDMANNLEGATKDAQELSKALLGIDELNIISPTDQGGGGGAGAGGAGAGGGAGGAGGAGFEVGSLWDDGIFEGLEELNEKIEGLKKRIKEMLPTIAAVAAAFAAWKIAKGLIKGMAALKQALEALGSVGSLGNFMNGIVGITGFLSDMEMFERYFEDFLKNGPTFENVVGMLSQFAGMIGNVFIMFGQVHIGAALELIDGIGTIVSELVEVSKSGWDVESVLVIINGMGEVAKAVGLFTGKLDVVGWGMALEGFSGVLLEISDNWEAIKKGDWSGVDKLALVNFAIEGLAGLAISLGAIDKIKGLFKKGKKSVDALDELKNATQALGNTTSEVGEATSGLSDATSSLNNQVETGVSPKLKSLAKNLGFGMLIIVEVAAAALLIVGAIAALGVALMLVATTWTPVLANAPTIVSSLMLGAGLLATIGFATNELGKQGKTMAVNVAIGTAILAEIGVATGLFVLEIAAIGLGLQKVAEAWTPVMSQGNIVITAIALGAGLLAGVGAVTAGLGTVGKTLVVNMGIGTAILAEAGLATGLFVAEIWAIGLGLQQVGLAWAPVIANGATIASAIAMGTALLVGIGTVTALLGTVTVASGGTIPVAIGLGTAMLVLLSEALILFVAELTKVADKLANQLHPKLVELNAVLPMLNENMANFVNFMGAFAGEVVRYTQNTAIADLSATIDMIVGWFTKDSLQSMITEVSDVYAKTVALNGKLEPANAELQRAINLLHNYTGFMQELSSIAGGDSTTVALGEGLKVNMQEVGSAIVLGFNQGITNSFPALQGTITLWGKNVNNWFKQGGGGVNAQNFSKYGREIVQAFGNAVRGASGQTQGPMVAWANNVKNWFSKGAGAVNGQTWQKFAKEVVTGFTQGLRQNQEASKTAMRQWAKALSEAFKESCSPDKFQSIGRDVVLGFNAGVGSLAYSTMSTMRRWASQALAAFKAELNSHSPSRKFRDVGFDVIRGFNLGIERMGGTTRGVMQTWADSFTDIAPKVSFAVDTSSLKYYDTEGFAKEVSTDFAMTGAYSVEGFKEGMESFFHEYIEPTMKQMADDMKRQADKQEKTVVQIGNRVVADSVNEQRKANGYCFVK